MSGRSLFAARNLPVPLIVLGAGGLAAHYALKASQWVVMTDELQTSKLATRIAQTLSLVPRIHGETFGGRSQLYPLVIAPLFGLLPVPAAVGAAHVLNAFLLASAGWPAYLLARAVTGSRAAGWFAAALTAFVPWLVLSSTLLTENVAYPVFVWTVFLAHRALVQPSVRRDAAALAGLALAFFARPQLVVVAVALPVVLVAHELGFAAASAGGRRLAALRAAALRTVSTHPLLAGVYAAGGAGAGAVAAFGSYRTVFGTYAAAFQGDLFPTGVWRFAAAHLDYVVVAVGIVPFLLAAGWTLATVLRPSRREGHAFAVLVLALVPLLTIEVASFDIRFTEGLFIADRYLFYVVPLFAVAASAALRGEERRLLGAVSMLAAGIGFAWLAGFASYGGGIVIYWASPSSAFHHALATGAGWVGLSADTLVRRGGLVLAAVLAAVVWRAPGRLALAVAGVALSAFGAFEAGYVFDRFGVPLSTRLRTAPEVRRDWVDAALPAGSSAALVPNPYLGPEYWWDAEFWNKTVDRVLRYARATTYTTFPADVLSFDSDTGQARVREPTDLLVVSLNETRLRLAGTVQLAAAPPLALVRVARPYWAEWLTNGATPDGWTLPGKPVHVRLFPGRRPGRRDVVLTVAAPREAERPQHFVLRSRGTLRRGLVAPGGVRRIRVSLCVASGGFGSATLVTRGAARIPDGRVVGVHVDRIEAQPAKGRCSARRAPAGIRSPTSP